MKVTKWVEFEKEIEVEVSAEEFIAAIAELPDGGYFNAALNAFAGVIRRIPDTVIADMSPHARKTVADFLREQAKRFDPEVG